MGNEKGTRCSSCGRENFDVAYPFKCGRCATENYDYIKIKEWEKTHVLVHSVGWSNGIGGFMADPILEGEYYPESLVPKTGTILPIGNIKYSSHITLNREEIERKMKNEESITINE